MDQEKLIVITGANSYLGSAAVEYFLTHTTFFIVAFVSENHDQFVFRFDKERIIIIKCDLTAGVPENGRKYLLQAGFIFHFAWTRMGNLEKVTEDNTQMIRQISRYLKDPACFYFISSAAGTPHAKSNYGKSKFSVSDFVRTMNATVLCCGLVVEQNPGKGPFRILTNFAANCPVAVRIQKNAPSVYPVKLDDILSALQWITTCKPVTGTYKLFRESTGFNEFMMLLEKSRNKRRITLHVSTAAILNTAIFLKKIKIGKARVLDQVLTFFYKDRDYLDALDEIPGNAIRTCRDSSFFQ